MANASNLNLYFDVNSGALGTLTTTDISTAYIAASTERETVEIESAVVVVALGDGTTKTYVIKDAVKLIVEEQLGPDPDKSFSFMVIGQELENE